MANPVKRAAKYGPGGRKCVCCGPAPSQRKRHDRQIKRRERHVWKSELIGMTLNDLPEDAQKRIRALQEEE